MGMIEDLMIVLNAKISIMNLIFVDDDEEQLALYKCWIDNHSEHNAIFFIEPRDALVFISSESLPDLVITDHDMPGMNGLDFTHALKQIYDVPTIMVSSSQTKITDDIDFVILKSNCNNVLLLEAITTYT